MAAELRSTVEMLRELLKVAEARGGVAKSLLPPTGSPVLVRRRPSERFESSMTVLQRLDGPSRVRCRRRRSVTGGSFEGGWADAPCQFRFDDNAKLARQWPRQGAKNRGARSQDWTDTRATRTTNTILEAAATMAP